MLRWPQCSWFLLWSHLVPQRSPETAPGPPHPCCSKGSILTIPQRETMGHGDRPSQALAALPSATTQKDSTGSRSLFLLSWLPVKGKAPWQSKNTPFSEKGQSLVSGIDYFIFPKKYSSDLGQKSIGRLSLPQTAISMCGSLLWPPSGASYLGSHAGRGSSCLTLCL